MKIRIGLIEGIWTRVLTISKTKILPKIDVTIGGILTEVFTVAELTGTKIGAINVIVDKIMELDGPLTIHAEDDADEMVDSVVEEDVCNSVDEVLETSIDDT